MGKLSSGTLQYVGSNYTHVCSSVHCIQIFMYVGMLLYVYDVNGCDSKVILMVMGRLGMLV